MREVLGFFVRAAHVAIAHGHGFNAIFEKEFFHLLLDFWISRNVRSDPAIDDRLGTVMKNYACGDLRGSLVVGAVQRHGADGVFRTRSLNRIVLDQAAFFVLHAAPAGARIIP